MNEPFLMNPDITDVKIMLYVDGERIELDALDFATAPSEEEIFSALAEAAAKLAPAAIDDAGPEIADGPFMVYVGDEVFEVEGHNWAGLPPVSIHSDVETVKSQLSAGCSGLHSCANCKRYSMLHGWCNLTDGEKKPEHKCHIGKFEPMGG